MEVSNKIEITRANSDTGTILTKISACQTENNIKIDEIDSALMRIKRYSQPMAIQLNYGSTSFLKFEKSRKLENGIQRPVKDTAEETEKPLGIKMKIFSRDGEQNSYLILMISQTRRMELSLEMSPPADEIHQMTKQLTPYWPKTRMELSEIGPGTNSTNIITRYRSV